jgi:Ca2+-binding RTX toxin-like protein
VYAGALSGVQVSLAIVGEQDTGGAGRDTLVSINSLLGSAFNDTLIGNDDPNIIEGGAGDDTLAGGLGVDTLSYASAGAGVTVSLATQTAQNTIGAGTDTATGFENLIGSAHNDSLTGTDLANVIAGGAGNDAITGGGGVDQLNGGDGDDTISGGLDADVLDGGAGLDNVAGGEGNDLLFGGGGNDRVYGDAGNDNLNGNEGDDSLYGGEGVDTLQGGLGNDFLDAGAGADTLNGGDGNDTLRGGADADALDGGAGADTADFRDRTGAVVLTLAGATLSTATIGGVAEDTLVNIENVIGGTGADTLTGDAGANSLFGWDGDDVLRGGAGADLMDGGAGADMADYRDQTVAVVVTLNGAVDATVSIGGVVEDRLRNIEHVRSGSGADVLTGDSSANGLYGFAGDDVLRGGGGADALVGGTGVDVVDYRDKTTAVVLTLNGGSNVTVTVGGVAEDTIREFESVYGGSAADTLTGDAAANTFRGGGGADVLNGAGGVDTLDFSDKTTSVVLTLNGATTATATVGGVLEDTFRNFENVIGGSGADTLTGDALANALQGGLGDDILTGAGGADVLTGGGGLDTFVYSALGDSTVAVGGRDRIADFVRGSDKIDLRGIDASTATADDQAFTFSTAFAAGSPGRLIVTANGTGNWLVQGDVDGNGVADFAIEVLSATALTATDFLL